ncbi:MAG TPA: PCYCGC motif-containing (lipo)protein [Symbiobacteriaceae bacterium]|nr:PCYCGC motif-containing (lipo)protein [Symbiobacteriaceae bacterium]
MPARGSARSAPQSARGGQLKLFIAGALIIAVLTGGLLFGMSRIANQPDHTASAGAPPAAIDGAGPMPAWLASANTAVIADYSWAASHHDELQYFPCFCGCDKSAGHVSNSDCYYVRDGKGTIARYDSHAYG